MFRTNTVELYTFLRDTKSVQVRVQLVSIFITLLMRTRFVYYLQYL